MYLHLFRTSILFPGTNDWPEWSSLECYLCEKKKKSRKQYDFFPHSSLLASFSAFRINTGYDVRPKVIQNVYDPTTGLLIRTNLVLSVS